jgi:hypothetical protein
LPSLLQEFLGVLKKIADKNYFIVQHFQYGGAFILVGLVAPATAFICPMNGGLAALADCPLNLESQLGILTEKDAYKFQDAFYSDQRLGFGEIKLGIFVKQVSHLIHVATIEDFKEFRKGLIEGHQKNTRFLCHTRAGGYPEML